MPRRDTAEFLRRIREFLLGRKPVGHARFQPDLSARTQPLPNIPPGPSSKLNNNYYFNRDARRQVKTPTILLDCSAKLDETAEEKENKTADDCDEKEGEKGGKKASEKGKKSVPNKKSKIPTPGKIYKY